MFETEKRVLSHYLSQDYAQRGWKWDSDNQAEIDSIFDEIELVIKQEVERQVSELMKKKYKAIGNELLEITNVMKSLAKDLQNAKKELEVEKPFYKKNLDGDLDD
jgi:ribosome-binding ATPase YchF (GTP1/OBG family)